MFSLAVVLLTIGEIMTASSHNVRVYAGAQVFWAFGYTGALPTGFTFCAIFDYS